MGTTIISYPLDLLDADPDRQAKLDEIEEIVKGNPIEFFVPQDENARDFLNDTEHTLKCLIAPNGYGKSVAGWMDMMLDIVPCKKEWPVFALHGIKFRRYTGPFRQGGVGIVSYDFINHRDTIFPQIIKRWTPPEFLSARAMKSDLSFRSAETIHVADTAVTMFACSQDTTVLSGSAKDRLWWDEQPTQEHFNEANARVRRRNGRHSFTLTPHRVPGRPDTGAGSFIHRLYKREETAGHSVKFYHGGLPDLPDWIFSLKAKRAAMIEWVEEPTRTGNISKMREGRARVFGEFHESSGLVFDEWSYETHVIPDDWVLPSAVTWYRYCDHGRLHPAVCLYIAATEEGDLIIDNEYYEPDRLVSDNAKGIVEKGGNRVKKDGFVETTNRRVDRFIEVGRRKYRRTKMDSRSFNKRADDSAMTIGQLYALNGLKCLPASGQTPKDMVPIAKEYLRIDPDRPHLITGKPGAPTVYVRARCKSFISEITNWIHEVSVRADRAGNKSVSEKPRDKDDHAMSCFLFACVDRPTFVEGWGDQNDEEIDEEVEEVVRPPSDPYGGY
jgi:hypothetical protein